MIDAFRSRGLMSVVMGAVIVAMILVFVIQFNPSAGKKAASLKQACAATVRGACIEPKDHKSEFLLVVPRDNSGAREFGLAKARGIPKMVLDGLIERELLISEADRLGLTVTQEEVNDALISGEIRVSLPADQMEAAQNLGVVDGRIWDFQHNRPAVFFHDPKTHDFVDQKAYARQLKNLLDRSPAEFREQQERELLAAKMRDLIRAPVRVSEAEALESYISEKSSASLSYVAVERAFVARWLVPTPTDAEVDAWAKEAVNEKAITDAIAARKAAPGTIAQGHIRHILVKVSPTASAEEHARALEKLTGAWLRIQRGESFFTVAKDVSEDGSKGQGGDVGDKTESFVASFRKAADALKPGEMTPQVIESQFGYHLIMRDDPARLEGDVKRELYLASRVDVVARDLATKILADMKAGKSADDAIQAAVGDTKPVPFLPVLADPTVVHTSPDAGAADATVSDAAATEAADAGAPPVLKKALDPSTDPDRPVVAQSGSFNRGGDPIHGLAPGDLSKLLDFAFGATSKEGDVYPDPIKTDTSFFVVQLKEHKNATREEFLKDRETYMQTLLVARQNADLAIYMKRLLDGAKADITRDPEYMAQWASDGGVDPDEEP